MTMGPEGATKESKHEAIYQAHKNLDRAVSRLETLVDRIKQTTPDDAEKKQESPKISLSAFLDSAKGHVDELTDRIGKACEDIRQNIF